MTTEKVSSAQTLVEFGLSVAKACNLCDLSRSTFYRPKRDWRKADSVVIDHINAALSKSPHAGFWKCFHRIRNKGVVLNHKRVYRVYCAMGLNLRRRSKRALPKRISNPIDVIDQPNRQWALDFVQDTLYCGKRFRTLNVLDEGTRECLAIETDTSLPGARVVRVLEQLKVERGLPNQIRLDNGPELICGAMEDWCEENHVELAFIQPGKPQQNAFVERFNGSFRREFLDAYLFETLDQVRDMAWIWRLDYNDERPHESLGDIPPTVYREKLENSTLELSQ